MDDLKKIWAFFSVLAAAFEENVDASVYSRWLEKGILNGSPFAGENRYVKQGVCQVKMWLEDFARDPEILERKKQDYLQLFIGVPAPLAPFWASCYREDKLLCQKTTADVSAWYKKFGLGLRTGREMPEDSIIYELFFLIALMEECQKAYKRGDKEKQRQYIQDMHSFIEEEMSDWISQWREDVMLYSRTEYYRGICNMAYGGISCLQEMLGRFESEADYN